jgi:hypothetical protein
MSKTDGINEAIELAVGQLENTDMNTRARLLGLEMADDSNIKMRVFGKDMLLNTACFSLKNAADGKDAKPADRLLALHYLRCELPVKPAGELISFRDFSGGQFYYQPFLARTVIPLAGRFGNDLEQLKKNLGRFDWTPLNLGDFAAEIHALGALSVTLIYRLGDDEFPAEAEVLFDASAKRIFEAEDAAVTAGRICIGLL